MQLATGGQMLNFGYWNQNNHTPLDAQSSLCDIVGSLAELTSNQLVLDVGSGLAAPAMHWKNKCPSISIVCININFEQLKNSNKQKLELINSSALNLSFTDSTFDTIIALESAQHIRPLENFISESYRLLKKNGIFVLAIPITTKEKSSLSKLGILSMTWSSEHYGFEHVVSLIKNMGFNVLETQHIGSSVYEPLCNYYVENRSNLRKIILAKYPSYVEAILFKSLKKMKQVSKDKVIDYVLIKCRK